MPEFELSLHAQDMLTEREIREEWLWQTLSVPDGTFSADDGTIHYTKAIAERDGRVLRVVTNPDVDPQRIVTVFFDRRLRGK